MKTLSRSRALSRRSLFLVHTLLGLTCASLAPAQAAESDSKLALKQFASGFTSPIALVPHGGKPENLVVADQAGFVQVLDPDGKTRPELFLDVRSKLAKNIGPAFDERGLLSIAFHPKFKQNRKFYVIYSGPLRASMPTNWNSTMNLSEFQVTKDNPFVADPASERIVLQIDKPAFNHNGGCLAFGPDGYLYLSVGDGGDGNDTGLGHVPEGNGQNKDTLLGKILRIDVNKGNPYAIPSDNPFAKGGGKPEIFAYGVRNSWRMSFDKGGKQQLFAADVGQNMFEEVNIIVNGGNYGWRLREGYSCFDPKNPNQPPTDCPKVGADGKPLIDPAFGYKNANGHRKDPEAYGTSITGGFVYRGKALKELRGNYIFADWSSNFVVPGGVVLMAAPPEKSGTGKWIVGPLDLATHPKGAVKAFVVSVGQDADGELYFLTNGSNQLNGKNGKVWKLVRAE